MKYTSLTYDINKPILQQITVPIDSSYGVALKVFKNDELLDTSISVDGVQTEDTNGWKTATLSSGSIPTIKQIDVIAQSGPTVDLNLDAEVSVSNPLPVAMLVNGHITIGDKVSGSIELPSDSVKSFVGIVEGTGETITWNNLRIKIGDKYYDYNPSIKSWVDNAAVSTPIESITIDSNT